MINNDSRHTLILFTKTPVAGQCKTRLIPSLGTDGALQAHITLVRDTLQRLKSLPVHKHLCVSQIDAQTQAWADEFGVCLREQQQGELGQRMHQAMATAFAEGAQRVCLLGSDIPLLDSGYVNRAFAELTHHDAVFAPSEDGGYALVGLNRPCAELFDLSHWSHARVLAQSCERAVQAGLAVQLLPQVWDVDTPADWQRFLDHRRRSATDGG